MLTVIDEYTRRCPAIVVARKLNSDDVHENDVCSLVAKAIQKLKKAVLREIEFEDGKIAWVDGLVLDRSRAIPLIDELLGDGNTDCFWDHAIVLDDELLLDFLMTGVELY